MAQHIYAPVPAPSSIAPVTPQVEQLLLRARAPRPGQDGGPDPSSRCDVRGFSGGMCTAMCNLGVEIDDAVCAVGQRPRFEKACFRPGVKPEDCLRRPGNFTRLLLHACSRTEPCRDDYLCVRVPDRPIDHGACAPPYRLRELRVDHAPIDL